MGEVVFACACLNVELRCPETSTKSVHDGKLELILGENLCSLAKPQKRVIHDWLLREKRCGEKEFRYCAACNALVFAIQGQDFVVSRKLERSDEELSSLRLHDCFSECLQIIIDPANILLQCGVIDNIDDTTRKDSLVPGYLESVRLKMVQVVKQMMTERHRIIEEEHRRALDQLRALQLKCDYQCNTLLKIIEYQENAVERRLSSATTKSCSDRSESMESKASLPSSKEPTLDDDVFEMQFNDEAIYDEDDSRPEEAEEARELSGLEDEDEGVSTASQERTQKSDMDLSQYATSLPIEVPKEASTWQGLRPHELCRSRLEQSPAKPEFDDIARSMKDLSDRMMDDQTKMFGEVPRPRLYTNHF